MPMYEYQCNNCGRDASLFYKTYADYDAAIHTCPHCGSTDLTRLISRVTISKPSRDYNSMSSDEMLSVFESGDSRAVGEMMQQVTGDDTSLGANYHEAAKRLRGGDSMENVERDLAASSDDDVL